MNDTTVENGVSAPLPSTLRQRISRFLFPQRFNFGPEYKGPITMRDYLVTNIRVEASFMDRLRFLVSGRCHVSLKVLTENQVGEHVSQSEFSVTPPAFLSDDEH